MSQTIWILEEDKGDHPHFHRALGEQFELLLFSEFESFQKALNEPGKQPHLIIAVVESEEEADELLQALNHHEKVGNGAPYLVVSYNDDLELLRKCFENGALDYLTKPVKNSELLAKVEKALIGGARNIELDAVSLTVRNNQKQTPVLTPKEFKIVAVLFNALEKKMERNQLIEKIWGKRKISVKALDVHLSNLRKKLKAADLDVRLSKSFYCLVDINRER